MYGQADTTSHTVTQAVSNPLSSSFTVVANDMAVNTAYRLTAWGIGTWGSTQQQLTLSLNYGGVSLTTLAIASTAFAASAAVRWKLTGLLVGASTGSSGTLFKNITCEISETANPVNPGTAATNAIATTGGSGTSTIDTTIDNAFVFGANWASTTGAPTVTCQATIFERVN